MQNIASEAPVMTAAPARLLILVGAEASLQAYADAASARTAVVGLHSFTGMREEDGAPHAGLQQAGGREVVLFCDPATDPATDPASFDSVLTLDELLILRGAASFKIYTSSMTAAEYAASAADLMESIKRIFSSATARPVKRPKTRRGTGSNGASVAGGAVVNPESLTIEVPAAGDFPPAVQLNAAVRIEKAREVVDDLNDPHRSAVRLEYSLEVSHFDESGLARTHRITQVDDADLDRPRTWLRKLGTEGVTITEAPAAGVGKAIAAAIRQNSPALVQKQTARARTGWLRLPDGRHAYLLHEQAITTTGDASSIAAGVLEGEKRDVRLPDPTAFTPKQIREDARSVFEGINELGAPISGYAFMGSIAWSFAGCGVGGGIWLWGRRSSGKTTVAKGFAGMLGAVFGTDGRNIATMDGSKAVGTKIGHSLHNAFVVVDDARKRQSQFADEIEAEVTDDLSRRAYGGAAAGRPRNQQINGSWVVMPPEASEVAVIGVGEHPVIGEESTRMRFHHVQQPDTDGFRSGDAARFKQLMAAGTVSRHSAAFIMWLAGKLDEAGSLTAWQQQCAVHRTEAYTYLNAHNDSDARFAEIASVFPAGLSIWARFLEEVGAITVEERTAFEAEALAAVEASMKKNAADLVKAAPMHEQLLQALHTALGNGDAEVSDLADQLWAGATRKDFATLIGRRVAGRNGAGDFVGLMPAACLTVLRFTPYGRLTPEAFVEAFAEVSLDRDSPKKTRRILMNSAQMSAVAIPVELFLAEKTDGDDLVAAGVPEETPTATFPLAVLPSAA